jgi:hypothetical protein
MLLFIYFLKIIFNINKSKKLKKKYIFFNFKQNKLKKIQNAEI